MAQANLEEPQVAPPRRPSFPERLSDGFRRAVASARGYFENQDPTFWVALTPALAVAAVLFVRSPLSNYIFDEQEALLANPYVNGEGSYVEALRRDFWGLPPERSIGSYRPIPNFIWRALWSISDLPFLHHWVNVVGHALNATLLAGLVFAMTRRRRLGWLAGACFLCSAVLTEAVTGVVGIADVLGGLGVLLSLSALRLSLFWMPAGVFLGLTFGLFSKESALVGVPLIGWAALVTAPALHARPRRLLRAALAAAAATLALITYTELRKRLFPVSPPAELLASLPPGAHPLQQALHAFLRWFQQPQLPRDPINNPLVDADTPHRIAGALRVFAHGLGQVLFPWTLSGDYSYAQEPVPTRLVFPGSVIGALALAGLPLFSLAAYAWGAFTERRDRRSGTLPSPRLSTAWLLSLGALWLPVAYFPHSNLAVLLPTVRAERFWYLPMVGGALVLAVLLQHLMGRGRPALGRLALVFFVVQSLAARAHALDYTDDLSFWRATRVASPNSAKAHLNYSVMVGARGRLEERLVANARAKEIAPRWPMGHIYYGDTLCRLDRPQAAWPHYRRGFELGPNESNLIALALQCLWDKKALQPHEDELLELADKHPGSWLAFLATDIVEDGKKYGGVQKKYRPRAYDEGPKKRDR